MGNDRESTHSGEGLGDKSEDEVAQGGGFDVDSDLTGEDFAPSVFTPILQQKRMEDDSVLGVVSKKKTPSVLVENLLSQNTSCVSGGFSATHMPSDSDNVQSSSQMIVNPETKVD